MTRATGVAIAASCLAFLAIPGSAFARDTAPKNSVVSKSIKDGEVKTPDLANGAVTAKNVKNDTLTGDQIDELSLDLSVLQARIDGSCSSGQAIRAIAGDGSVTCQPVGGTPSWSLTGNTGTTPGTDFIGTTDNQVLDFRVNGLRALEIRPNATAPSMIGGLSGNAVTSGVAGATISGGGLAQDHTGVAVNSVTDDFGTVAGGYANHAGDGAGNTTDNRGATVGGGDHNTASGQEGTIAGGNSNVASGTDSAIAGGSGNHATGTFAVAAGGGNTASQTDATVSGGGLNTASAEDATVGGGTNNTASFQEGTIGGGSFNTVSGQGSVVAGGNDNAVSGNYSAIGGGAHNAAGGDGSFVAGYHAGNATGQNGDFLFSDVSSNQTFTSAAQNEFAARATGGVRFVTAINGTTGAPTAGVQLAAGGGSWSSLSDRNAKNHVHAVSSRAVLRKVAGLPVHTWSYKSQSASIRHLGPMAQAFYKRFGLGEDNKHIDDVDAQGVALAAIKGAAAKIREQHRQIAALQKAVRRLQGD